jgi:hypothetical protein
MKTRILVCAALFGCGGGDETVRGGGEDPAVDEVCIAVCEGSQQCGEANDFCDRQYCEKRVSRWRDEAVDIVNACFDGLGGPVCEEQYFQCFAKGVQSVEPRPIDDEFTHACQVRGEACMSSFGDYCGSKQLYDESTVQEGLACLELPCEQVMSCLNGLFG